MTSENLAICFVPFLIQQKSKNASSKDFLKNLMDGKLLITFIIENYKELFDTNLIQQHYDEYRSIPMEVEKKSNTPERKNSLASPQKSQIVSMLRKSSLSLSRSNSPQNSPQNSPKTSPKNSPTSSSSTQTLNIKYDPSTAKYLTVWNKNMFFLQMNQKEVI
jgi:hypothetical protein